MPPTDKPSATSTQIFQAAPKASQEIIKDLLSAERRVAGMITRPEIHQNFVQIIKKHVTKPSAS
jgi:hypothetical protein